MVSRWSRPGAAATQGTVIFDGLVARGVFPEDDFGVSLIGRSRVVAAFVDAAPSPLPEAENPSVSGRKGL
jgi:hypothetical protein